MSQAQTDVLYVADMARKLGTTEAAIRAGVNREVDWLPKHFKRGRRIAWLTADVDAFLAAQVKKGGKK